jgi:cytochrome b561
VHLHLALAVALIMLAGIHALAALKHPFSDRVRTLVRMLGRTPPRSRSSTPSRRRA